MDHISRIVKLLADGELFCSATIISSSRPELPVGLKVLALRDGTLEGEGRTAGPDSPLRAPALEALKEKKSRTAEVEPGVLAFFDIISSGAELLICGAGHIAMPLARFARETGFRVTVLDDRPDFANQARFPGCEVIADDFTSALRRLTLGPAAYAVVITRGHEHDAECLAEILKKETAYTGFIGSRRRGRLILENLGGKGLPAGRLAEVFTPIGLPIGAESPEEIALAIAAELVCVRRCGATQAKAFRAGTEAK